MAGIGVKLTNIYKKNTLTTDIIGAGYSAVRHLHDAEVHSTGKYWSHSAQSLFSDRQSADHKVRDN